ncbi:MAG: hypothetical protein WHX53_09960 [Anaerolineae bacterium]
MKVNPFVYGALILVLFFGVIGGAKAAGVWSVSGKLTSSGEKVLPTGTNPDEIKGWMTLNDVAKAYNVSVAEILAHFNLPADTPGSAQIKSLESDTFSTSNLRTWLKERLGQ